MNSTDKIIPLPNPEFLIERYNLEPHPEGGYAQLLYEDPQFIEENALPKGFSGKRSIWNGIYFLILADQKSVFHRIKMNELWNFYFGAPLELFDLSPDGVLKRIILGSDPNQNHQFAYVFPKDHWIAAKPKKDPYSFVSCITAPGFTFADWERGDKLTLLKQFPHLTEIIQLLT